MTKKYRGRRWRGSDAGGRDEEGGREAPRDEEGGLVFVSGRRRNTRYWRDWSSEVCSSDLWVSEVGPRGATVYAQAGTHPVLESYRRIGELRRDLRPAYLAALAPEGPAWDEEPREDSYFLFLPRQSIYTHQDRKSTRLNSSHAHISYAVFCLKK